MRLKGFTDSEGWHLITLLSMIADPKTWEGGVTWGEWRLDAFYPWYDGPIFMLRFGPFWAGLSTH